LNAVPFDSVDATTWNYRPRAFGQWVGFDNARLSTRSGGTQRACDYWVEVEAFLKRAEWARARWRVAYEQLEGKEMRT
jgi:hypothetical protein